MFEMQHALMHGYAKKRVYIYVYIAGKYAYKSNILSHLSYLYFIYNSDIDKYLLFITFNNVFKLLYFMPL